MDLNFPSTGHLKKTTKDRLRTGVEAIGRREETVTKTRTELQPLTWSFIPGEWRVRLHHFTAQSRVHWCWTEKLNMAAERMITASCSLAICNFSMNGSQRRPVPVAVSRSLGLLPSRASHFLGSVRVFSPRSTSKLSHRSRRQFSVFAMAAEGSSLSLKSMLIIALFDQFPFFGLILVYPLFNSPNFSAKVWFFFF